MGGGVMTEYQFTYAGVPAVREGIDGFRAGP